MKTKLMIYALCVCMLSAGVLQPAAAEYTAGVGHLATAGKPAGVGHPAEVGHPATASAFLPQPFSLHYERYDYHVMLTFEGHPEYEAVEAFIRETPELEIRAVVTRHDQSQTDYFNTEDFTVPGNGSGVERERMYAPMTYERGGTKKAPSVSLSFTTKTGEAVAFFLEATSAPMKKYGGMIDPGSHSAATSLPVMFCEGSSLASEESFISFDGVRYDIPILVDAAPFFTGYKGYYSEAMRIAVIRSGSSQIEFTRVPDQFVPGEKWVFMEDGVPQEWTITKRHGSSVYVSGPDRVLRCMVSGNRVGLLSIACTSDDPDMTFIVDFDKPVRISGGEGSRNTETEFSLSIAGKKRVVTGTVSVESDAAQTRIVLSPRSPDWAVPRGVSTTLTDSGSTLKRDVVIVNGE